MDMRKLAALIALLLLPWAASAEGQSWAGQKAVAVTQTSEGTAAMYEKPDEESAVLMRYYSGAPLEIIRQASGDFFLVQAGTDGAGVRGYMRAEELLAGDTAQRQVRPSFMRLEFNQEAAVYAYCDEGAQVIGFCDPQHTYYAMGKNDGKWVQLYLPPEPHVWEEDGLTHGYWQELIQGEEEPVQGKTTPEPHAWEDRLTRGFVKLETGMARGYWQELTQWEVEPVQGEITPEQVREMAIGVVSGTHGEASFPEVYTLRENLVKMGCRAYLRQMEGAAEPDWWVYFWERPGGDAVQLRLTVSAQGETSWAYGYIPPEDWGAYAVTPVL